MAKFTRDQWIAKAQKIHGNLYDYSEVDYQGINQKVTINCLTHGPWEVSPNNHVNHQSGCPKCSITRVSLPDTPSTSGLIFQMIKDRYIQKLKEENGEDAYYGEVDLLTHDFWAGRSTQLENWEYLINDLLHLHSGCIETCLFELHDILGLITQDLKKKKTRA